MKISILSLAASSVTVLLATTFPARADQAMNSRLPSTGTAPSGPSYNFGAPGNPDNPTPYAPSPLSQPGIPSAVAPGGPPGYVNQPDPDEADEDDFGLESDEDDDEE